MDPKNMITREEAIVAMSQWNTVLMLIRAGVPLHRLDAIAQAQADAFGKLARGEANALPH